MIFGTVNNRTNEIWKHSKNTGAIAKVPPSLILKIAMVAKQLTQVKPKQTGINITFTLNSKIIL